MLSQQSVVYQARLRRLVQLSCGGPVSASWALTPVVRTYNKGMHDASLVVVHEFGSQSDADMAKGALAAAGIDSMIQADSVGGMRAHVAWSGAGFKVLVREEDAADAHDVLEPGETGADGH